MEKKLAQKLAEVHNTNDPFRIAANKDIKSVFADLGKTAWGFRVCVNRISIIYINNRLEYPEMLYTMAHELGHDVMHPHVNTPFLRANTLFSIDKIEREANRFGVHLLIGTNVIEHGEPLEHFLFRCGILKQMHVFY